VAVCVERQLDVRVTQSLLDDLGVRVSDQQVGSVAMTQIVQPDLGKAAGADQPSEGVSQHARRPGEVPEGPAAATSIQNNSARP
jgi:hypothetical protein